MTNLHKIISAAASLIACGILTAPASAQSIDYRSLEMLFGEPVTLSATGSPMRASEVPGTMTILTQNDIQRSGATSIEEVLRHVPGLSVQEWTQAFSDVGVRGYNQAYSSRLLVLVNGRQVMFSYWSFTPWRSLPVQLSEIQQIEIVSGPNTALFGFNAVSGVVNIITNNPLQEMDNVVTVRGGEHEFRQANAVIGFHGENFGVRASGGFTGFDEYDTANSSNTTDVRDDADFRSGMIEIAAQVASGHTMGFEATVSNAEYTQMWPVYQLNAMDQENISLRGYYTGDTDYGLIQANVYYNSVNHPVGNDLWVAQIQDIFKVGTDHTIRIAGEYRHNTMESYLDVGLSDFTRETFAVSGMWSWAINSELSWTNAVRVDRWETERGTPLSPLSIWTPSDFDQSEVEFSFNTGLVYRPDAVNTFRLSAGRGVQVASPVEAGGLSSTDTGAGFFFTGNPYNETIEVMNVEGSYERQVSEINGSVGVNVFYQENTNLIALDAYPYLYAGVGPLVLEWENIGDSTMFGFEVLAEGRVGDNFDWDLGYTHISVEDDLANYTTGIGYTHWLEFERSTPEHQVNAHLGYTRGAFQADVFGVYWSDTERLIAFDAGPLNFPTLVPVDGGFNADARLAYTWNNVTLAVEGHNLLDSPQQQTSGPEVGRRVTGSLTARF